MNLISGFRLLELALRQACDEMQVALAKSGDGRKYSISLEALEYSGDLAKQMMDFSCKMEGVWKALQGLVSKKVEAPEQYRKQYKTMQDLMGWFEKAEASAKGLLTSVKPKKRKSKKNKDEQEAK